MTFYRHGNAFLGFYGEERVIKKFIKELGYFYTRWVKFAISPFYHLKNNTRDLQCRPNLTAPNYYMCRSRGFVIPIKKRLTIQNLISIVCKIGV